MANRPVTGPMSECPQPLPGMPAPKIELFWDKDCDARKVIAFEGVDISYLGDEWNDQPSSLKVHSGRWRLYQNINFNEGNMGTPIEDYIEVGVGTYGYIGDIVFNGQQSGDHWNDALTSLKPIAL